MGDRLGTPRAVGILFKFLLLLLSLFMDCVCTCECYILLLFIGFYVLTFEKYS